MPRRFTPFIKDQIYHTFNQGIDRMPTFTGQKEYERAMDVIRFYQYKVPIRFSIFRALNSEEKSKFAAKYFRNDNRIVSILSFCLMPNHFHFLLKQLNDNGIPRYLSIFQNSYTKFINTKNNRKGSLFLDQFKAVRIETDEQLIHVSRYIHLNPYTAYILKSLDDLENYPWSSFKEFINGQKDIVDTEVVLSYFKNTKDYKNFVYDQAAYQRKLDAIKHLVLEETELS